MRNLLLCLVPLLVLFLVQDSTETPGPRPQFVFNGGFDVPEFVPFVSDKKQSKSAEQVIHNTTTIGGYINGHQGNNNGDQGNNTIQLHQASRK